MRRRRAGSTEAVLLGAGMTIQNRNLATLEPPGSTKGPEVGNSAPALLGLSEREFQRMVRGALESRGFVVWVVPMMKLTTAGLPDILAWHPRLRGCVFALELKREKDYRVTPRQRAALAHLATVEGIVSQIVRPSDWPGLRDTIDAMIAAQPAAGAGAGGGER